MLEFYKRAHPLNIIESTFKYYPLLLLPVISGLLRAHGDFYKWLRGTWFDILIIGSIFFLGFINWYFNNYRITPDGIYVYKGCFRIRAEYFAFEKIASVSVEDPFFFRLFRAVRVTADTDAGNGRKPDFKMTLNRSESVLFMDRARQYHHHFDRKKNIFSQKLFHVAVLSLFSSSSFTGVLFASTLITQSGSLLGKGFEKRLIDRLTSIGELFAFKAPSVAATAAVLLMGGWLLAFLLNIIRHKGFTVTRQGDAATISTGIFIKRKYLLNTRRINLVTLRQSLLTKWFKYAFLFVHCNGYGKQKNELAVMIPGAKVLEIKENLSILLPNMKFGKKDIEPRKDAMIRFTLFPIVYIIIVIGLMIFLRWRFPEFRDLIVFSGVMLIVPGIWFTIVQYFAFKHSGIGLSDGFYTLYYTSWFIFATVAVPVENVVRIEIYQSVFQRQFDVCHVVFFTYSEGRARHMVMNLNLQDALKLTGMEATWWSCRKRKNDL